MQRRRYSPFSTVASWREKKDLRRINRNLNKYKKNPEKHKTGIQKLRQERKIILEIIGRRYKEERL